MFPLSSMLYSVTQWCPTSCDPMDCSPPSSSVHGDSPGKNTGVGCHALLSGSSQPRDSTQVSHIAGRFFFFFYHLSHQGSLPFSTVFSIYQTIRKCCFNRWLEKSSERTYDDDIVLIRSWILKKNEFILYFWLRLVMNSKIHFFLCKWSFPA